MSGLLPRSALTAWPPFGSLTQSVTSTFGVMGVDLGVGRIGQPSDRSAGGIGEIEVAVDRNEDRLAVGRPFIFDDTLGPADATALAAHLFGFADLAAAKLGRIDQHPHLA